jgi:hypothetical protein
VTEHATIEGGGVSATLAIWRARRDVLAHASRCARCARAVTPASCELRFTRVRPGRPVAEIYCPDCATADRRSRRASAAMTARQRRLIAAERTLRQSSR